MRFVTVPEKRSPSLLRVGGLVVLGFFALIGLVTVFGASASTSVPARALPPSSASKVAASDGLAPNSGADEAATGSVAPSGPLLLDDASGRPPAASQFAVLRDEAQAHLAAKLDGVQGIRYSGVGTHIMQMSGDGAVVAFCGSLTFDMPDGSRSVGERFIASRSTAVTEADMTPSDFSSAWIMFCGGMEGPPVWH